MEPGGIILKEFYAAIVDRDMAKARSYLADDMVYHGIFKDLPSADAYMAVFASFMSFTTRLDVQMILCEGENAAIFYEMETTKPARAVTFVGEWHKIRNGKIVWARAACDGRPWDEAASDKRQHSGQNPSTGCRRSRIPDLILPRYGRRERQPNYRSRPAPLATETRSGHLGPRSRAGGGRRDRSAVLPHRRQKPASFRSRGIMACNRPWTQLGMLLAIASPDQNS